MVLSRVAHLDYKRTLPPHNAGVARRSPGERGGSRRWTTVERIRGTEKQEDALALMFTDAPLARGNGEALHRAYQGGMDFPYTKDDIMLRVAWTR